MTLKKVYLLEKQFLFMQLLPKLINKINETHHCSGGDLFAKTGHKEKSNHYIRLAIDLNLFTKEGAYVEDSLSHKPFGEYWENLHPLCRWGGRWNDGNHYSLEHEGNK